MIITGKCKRCEQLKDHRGSTAQDHIDKTPECIICSMKTPWVYKGQAMCVDCILTEGDKTAAGEIIKFCRDNLVKYKVPKKVIFKDDIPTNIAGKKLRRVLREEVVN